MRVTPGHQFGQIKIILFLGNYFWKTLNGHISSTLRAFNLIPKLRARPEYQLYFSTKYINGIMCDSHKHYFDIETIQSFLDNPSGPQSNAIKYKFMTRIWSLFGLQMSSHMWTVHLDDSGTYNWMVQIYVNWPSKWTVWWRPIGQSKYTVTDRPNERRSNGPSMLNQFGPSKWTTLQWAAYVTSIWTVQNYDCGPLFWTVKNKTKVTCADLLNFVCD